MKPGDQWVTFEHADGSDIWGDYAFVADEEFPTKADYDEPTVVLKKTWILVRVDEITVGPKPSAKRPGEWGRFVGDTSS